MHFLIRVCSKASTFSNCLDTVKSKGFVLMNTYVYSKVFNCSVLLKMSGSITWCRGLPGLRWAGNPASIQSREEMKKWQFLKLI